MNKKLEFNHQYTPPKLSDLNAQLEKLMAKDEVDEARLLQLITERDETVKKHLESLTEDALTQFVRAELKVNELLSTSAKKLLSESLTHLSGLIRGKKAVERYK